jgi:hypothetical protein
LFRGFQGLLLFGSLSRAGQSRRLPRLLFPRTYRPRGVSLRRSRTARGASSPRAPNLGSRLQEGPLRPYGHQRRETERSPNFVSAFGSFRATRRMWRVISTSSPDASPSASPMPSILEFGEQVVALEAARADAVSLLLHPGYQRHAYVVRERGIHMRSKEV